MSRTRRGSAPSTLDHANTKDNKPSQALQRLVEKRVFTPGRWASRLQSRKRYDPAPSPRPSPPMGEKVSEGRVREKALPVAATPVAMPFTDSGAGAAGRRGSPPIPP